MRFKKVMRVLSVVYAAIVLPLNMMLFWMTWGYRTGRSLPKGLDLSVGAFVVVTAALGMVLARAATTDSAPPERYWHLLCLALGTSILVAQGVSSLLWAYAPDWLLVAIAPYPVTP